MDENLDAQALQNKVSECLRVFESDIRNLSRPKQFNERKQILEKIRRLCYEPPKKVNKQKRSYSGSGQVAPKVKTAKKDECSTSYGVFQAMQMSSFLLNSTKK